MSEVRVISCYKMDYDNETTGDSEDEMDSYSLQYQQVDSSILGTAVFIKNVQIEKNDLVLLYVHQNDGLEEIQSHRIIDAKTLNVLALLISGLFMVAVCYVSL